MVGDVVLTLLRRAIDVVLAALLVAVLAIALASYLIPAAGGRLLTIRSGSMAPALDVGALVVVVPADPAALGIGDMVSVELETGVVLTHRITSIVEGDDRPLFQLKGDANPAPDPVAILPGQIVGEVALGLPLLGYLLAMMSMPAGVAALLSGAITLIVAAWLLDDDMEPLTPDVTARRQTRHRGRASLAAHARGGRARR